MITAPYDDQAGIARVRAAMAYDVRERINDDPEQAILDLKVDPLFFIRALWMAMGWDGPAPLGLPELDMVDWVIHGPDECGVLAPRGIGKTHLLTNGCTLFLVNRNPDIKAIINSAGAPLARDIIGLARKCVRAVPFLRHLEPRIEEKDAQYAFQVGPATPSKDPTFYASGNKGQITGRRAHVVWGDDLETPDNCGTLTARDSLEQRTDEFSAVQYVSEGENAVTERRRVVDVGTIHHEDSVHFRLATKKGFTFRTWPQLAPGPGAEHMPEDNLNVAPLILDMLRRGELMPGDKVFGHRITDAYIAKQKAKGRRYWETQHLLLRSRAQNRFPLRLEDLIVTPVSPIDAPIYLAWALHDNDGSTAIPEIPTMGIANEHLRRPTQVSKERAPYQGTKAWIDPAGLGDDELAVSSTGLLAGMFYVKGLIGLHVRDFLPHDRPGASELDLKASALSGALDRVALFLRLTRTDEVGYETNIDVMGAFGATLQHAIIRHKLEPGQDPAYPEGWNCRVTGVHSAQLKTERGGPASFKEARIVDGLEPLMSTHRLVCDPSVVSPEPAKDLDYQFQHQLAHMTRERGCLPRNDRADALTGNLLFWQMADVMAVNPTLATAEAARDRFIRRKERQAARAENPSRRRGWIRYG